MCPTEGGIDLYCTDQPCFGQNTTANPYLYAREATRLIRQQNGLEKADLATALMVFLALHNVHQPVESPAEFVNLYPASDYNSSNYARRIYNGSECCVALQLPLDWVPSKQAPQLGHCRCHSV